MAKDKSLIIMIVIVGLFNVALTQAPVHGITAAIAEGGPTATAVTSALVSQHPNTIAANREALLAVALPHMETPVHLLDISTARRTLLPALRFGQDCQLLIATLARPPVPGCFARGTRL